jgi:hypothetical protein
VRGQEFRGIASPSDAYHLPQILPQELKPFGRSGDDFGKVFLRVRGFLAVHPQTIRAPFPDSLRVADSPQGTRGPFGRPFRQKCGFSVGEVFCTADRPRLSFGQSAPPWQTVCSS